MTSDKTTPDPSAYQSALNQYSAAKESAASPPLPPPVPPTSVDPTIVKPSLQDLPHSAAEEPAASSPLLPPIPPASVEPTIVKPALQDLPQPTGLTPPSTKNPFKYVFFVSLFIFLVVLGSIVLSFYQQSQSPDQDITPTSLPQKNTPNPEEPDQEACLLNDQQYQVGETFPAADDCNTCTCLPSLIISCTNDDCQEQ